LKLVWCPPGFVTMEQVEGEKRPAVKVDKRGEGDADAEPASQTKTARRFLPVKVFLKHGYWLGKFEVTQAEWMRVMATTPWKGNERELDDVPVTQVGWDDAMEFSRKLTEREREAGRIPDGWEYTLPTEAQWERACRAWTVTNYSFGDDVSKL